MVKKYALYMRTKIGVSILHKTILTVMYLPERLIIMLNILPINV